MTDPLALRLLAGLGLFVGSLAAGWGLRRQGALTDPVAARLVGIVVKGIAPIVLCLAVWRMELRRLEPWLLPLAGLIIAASATLPALWYARTTRLIRPQAGSFLICAVFSNLGYLGAFLAFALYGEEAYALCVLYFTFFSPMFYTWGFWVASRYGGRANTTSIHAAAADELRWYPFVGLALGVLLSLAEVPRPPWCETINQVLIPIETALFLAVVGSQLTLASPRAWWRAGAVMSGVKFLYTPLVAWGLVTLLGLQGLPRTIVLLEASMPVGASPLVLPLLFDLDRDLANALWIITTVLAIPWLLLVLPLLQRL